MSGGGRESAQFSDCADKCAAPVTAKRTGFLRQPGGYFLTVLAVLACPCHLPVLMLLLGGTVAGTFLADHFGTFVAVASIVFLFSLIGALHFLTSDRGSS